ncbi:unnamed protein product [Effrenium voratum]|nr:unnamed protein product [Effrenium voratum]
MATDRLLEHVPLWAQRSSSELALARRQCMELALRLAEAAEGDDVINFMVQFGLSTCIDARAAVTLFQMLREAARKGGQRFTVEDVDASEHACLAALADRKLRSRTRQAASSDEGELSEDELSGEEAPDLEPRLRVTPELLADLGAELTAEELAADQYPSHLWAADSPHLVPGGCGFNARAARVMRRAGLGSEQAGSCPLQPHQEVVRFLVHPKAPVQRLLVDHPTGSGKTREMISILDNFFYDPRPKVVIFPKAAICRNFYLELLRWPSRYRDYFSCERPQAAAQASGREHWHHARAEMWDLTRLPELEVRQLCQAAREVLEMKGQSFRGQMRKSFRAEFRARHPGEPMPFAPLRAISYASAGGSYAALRHGQPVSAVMKIAWRFSENALDHKILVLDEAHQLLGRGRYAAQLAGLRRCLDAAHTVVVGFTGTLALDEPEEGRQLLDIVKGKAASDEGFLTSFKCRPPHLFAEALPRGVPDVLSPAVQEQLVHCVQLVGESLNVYDLKREKGLPHHRLAAYCNVSTFVSSFHDGISGSKDRVLACPEETCPKLWAVSSAVAKSSAKALVLTARACGFRVVLELLRRKAREAEPPFQVATMNELSSFNHISNAQGSCYRVLVANAAECSEGISFLAVRHVYLTEVPRSHGRFIQICGRALRMFGHHCLPQAERSVTYHLFLATLPPWICTPLAAWAFRAQPRRGYRAGHSTEEWARELFRKLQKRNVATLEDLQARISAVKAGHPEEELFAFARELENSNERCRTAALVQALRNLQNLEKESLSTATCDQQGLLQLMKSAELSHCSVRRHALDAACVQTDQLDGALTARRRLRCKTRISLPSERPAAGRLPSQMDAPPMPGGRAKRPRQS